MWLCALLLQHITAPPPWPKDAADGPCCARLLRGYTCAGAIALHVNSNENTDDFMHEAVIIFDAQWWVHALSVAALHTGAATGACALGYRPGPCHAPCRTRPTTTPSGLTPTSSPQG